MHRKASDYFADIFPGRVQKIAVNAGLGCPNRDGTLDTRGCIYCNNAAFNPRYAHDSKGSITSQIADGIEFFKKKGEVYGYLAYFQSYSNTYGPAERLISLYEEALSYPGVVGIVVGTRPDCISDEILAYFRSRFGADAPEGHPYLLVEIGVESTSDSTLLLMNRHHDYACCQSAITRLSDAGIDVGVHLILGLPGESGKDFIEHAERISKLPVKILKLHHLQVVRGTKLAKMYMDDPTFVKPFTPEEYAATVKMFIEHLREDIAIDRVVSETPKDLILAPAWGLKPSEFAQLLK